MPLFSGNTWRSNSACIVRASPPSQFCSLCVCRSPIKHHRVELARRMGRGGKAVEISAILPQVYIDSLTRPVPCHLYGCATSGKRVVYGSINGAIVRMLPNEDFFEYEPVETFRGSEKPLLCATMSPDNNAVCGGDDDGNVYIWLKKNNKLSFQTVQLEQMRYVKLRDIAVSPDSQRVVVGGVDRYTKKFGACITVDGGMPVGAITGHTLGILSVHFRPQKPFVIATGGLDGKICLHQGPPYKLHKTEETAHVGGVCVTRFSPDGAMLASGGVDKNVRLWDALTLDEKHSLTVPDSATVLSLSWNAESDKLAVVTLKNNLLILNVSANGLAVAQVLPLDEGLQNDVARGVCWTKRNHLAIVYSGGHVKGWRVQPQSPALPPRPAFTWHGPKGTPTSLSFHRESGNLLVGTTMGLVMFLSTVDSIPTALQVTKLDTNVTVKSTVISGGFGAAVTSDGTLKFFRVVSAQGASPGGAHSPIADGADHDQEQLIKTLDTVAGGDAAAHPLHRKLEAAGFSSMEHTPMKLALLDNEKFAATFSNDGLFAVYSIQKMLEGKSQESGGQSVSPEWFTRLQGQVCAATATTDGSLMAVAIWPNADYPLSKFGDDLPDYAKPRASTPSTQDSRTMGSLEAKSMSLEEKSPSMSAELSAGGAGGAGGEGGASPGGEADGEVGIAAKFVDATVAADAADTADTAKPVPVLTPYVNRSSLKPTIDTKHPLLEIYEIDSAASLEQGFRFIRVLSYHRTAVTALAVNAEGSLLASVDESRRIQVQEVGSGQMMITNQWCNHTTKVTSMDWSPDGTKLVSASSGGQTYIWDIDNPTKYICVTDSHAGGVQFVKFLFNNMVATGCYDGSMKVYEIDYD